MQNPNSDVFDSFEDLTTIKVRIFDERINNRICCLQRFNSDFMRSAKPKSIYE